MLFLSFSNVKAELNIKSCKPFLISHSYDKKSSEIKTDKKPVYNIIGDELKQLNTDIFYLKGNAKVISNDYILESNELSFNRKEKIAIAFSQVNLKQKNLIITASKLDTNQSKKEIHIFDAMYQVLPIRAFGEADKIDVYRTKNLTHLENASYTLCPIRSEVTLENNSLYQKNYNHDVTWEMRFNNLYIDEKTRIIYGTGVKLYLYQIPILYLPYISSTLDDRVTGFLFPKVGVHKSININSSKRYWKQPYFFNLAPNYDDTLSVTQMEDRGTIIENEFRYMNKTHKIDFTISGINDLTTEKEGIRYYLKNGTYETGDKVSQRWRAKLNANQYWNKNWSSGVKWQEVSDEALYGDLPLEPSLKTANETARNLVLNYKDSSSSSKISSSLTLSDPIRLRRDSAYNYNQKPNFKINYYKRLSRLWSLSSFTNITKFDLDKNLTNKAEGSRLYFKNQLKYRMDKSYTYSEAKFSLYTLDYELDDVNTKQTEVILPQVSLRKGLIFERNFNFLNTGITQTLTPEVEWLYTPYKKQNFNPSFDTSNLNTSFSNIFYENRFSGYDRIADSNQLNLALTTQFIDKESEYRLKMAIGQIIYLGKNKVTLAENQEAPNILTNYFTNVSFTSSYWQFFNNGEWERYTAKLKNISSTLQVRLPTDLLLFVNSKSNNLTTIKSKSETIAVGALWSPIDNWQFGSYIQHNYAKSFDKANKEYLIRYENCCLSTELNFHRQQLLDQSYNYEFEIAFKLKGLSGIGESQPLSKFLQNKIRF